MLLLPLTAAAAGDSASLKSTARAAFVPGHVLTGTGDRMLRYEIR